MKQTELTTPAATSTVSVRYFAGARAAAGRDSETVQVNPSQPHTTASVNDLIATLVAAHGSDLARVLSACSFLVNEVAGDTHRAVPDGAVVDVLPPFAGG